MFALTSLRAVSSDALVGPEQIGMARLQRLLRDAEGDHVLADELFRWNIRAAGAATEALHVFELVLRNAIDRELRTWNARLGGTPDWLLSPHPYLRKALQPKSCLAAAERARKVASEKRRPPTHDDVLAQMPFGTWRYLLPSNANKTKQRLWTDAVSAAFPHWPGSWSPESVVRRVDSAYRLRNRVAHLEPLHQDDLRAVRRDMRSVCHAIGVDAARLFVRTERLLELIETKPVSRLTEPRDVPG